MPALRNCPGTEMYPRSLLLLGMLPLLAQADALIFDETPDLPEVLTATRLQQAPAAVPGSVSVIDRELIRASGARLLPDVLRLVPGMLVVPKGNATTVNYHGSHADQARRLQVLVDGRSVYRAGLAQIDWNDIPIALEDIERIEVFRGPNTVSYGANALMAVVSITSRQPKDTHGTYLSYRIGSHSTRDWYASHSDLLGNGNYRLSLSGMNDGGFDHDNDGNRLRDGRQLSRLQLHLDQDLQSGSSLEWQLALKDGTNESNNDTASTLPIDTRALDRSNEADAVARDYATSLRWTHDLSSSHSLQLQGSLQHWERLHSWRACEASLSFSPELYRMWSLSPEWTRQYLRSLLRAEAPPVTSNGELLSLAGTLHAKALADYDPATGTFAHSCGTVEEDVRETRFDIELQDTLSLHEQLRLVSGISYRYDRASSDTYLGGSGERNIWRLFGQFEWQASPHWLLQGGSMFEYDSSVGGSLSPRLAVNYLITPAHGLRAVYSEAVRTPDMFENDARWQYLARNLSPAPGGQSPALLFAHASGPGDLEQERMRSRELGYNGHFSSLGLMLDFKLFDDQINNMISGPLWLLSFEADNRDSLHLRGAELELDWRPLPSDRLRLTWSHTRVDASNPLDERLTPRHSGTLSWMHEWGGQWSSALIYHSADSLNGYRFERLDSRLAREMHFGSTKAELAGVLQQRLDDEPLGWATNRHDDRRAFWLSLEVNF